MQSVMDAAPANGRSSFSERLATNKPGEERMLTSLRELLNSYGARKHDGDGFFHFPGHGWVCVECKNKVRPDGTFFFEKDSYHDAMSKLTQCRVLMLVDETNPRACWFDEIRIVDAKPRTPSGPHTSGDPAYIVDTNGDDGKGQFVALGLFVRREAKREVA